MLDREAHHTTDDVPIASAAAGTAPGRGNRAARLDAPDQPRDSGLVGGLPFRAEMEAAFGEDFSGVRVETGAATAMASIGAEAAAHGEQVAFADASPSKKLVAHELAHVVQHRRSGGGGGVVARKATVAPVDSPAEHEADRVADRVASGQPAGAIAAAPSAAIHRFAAEGHRETTVAGLKGSFSAHEIADIYAANWERDFSQCSPQLGNAVIAWTAVKQHYNDAGFNGAATTFRGAVDTLLTTPLDAFDTTLGDYQPWEHFDQPTGPAVLSDVPLVKKHFDPKAAADKRWAHGTPGLAGYLQDAKAHIKDQMVASVDLYRALHRLTMVGPGIDNWAGGERPEDYVAPTVTRSGERVTTKLPTGFNTPDVASRDPIREQTAAEATQAGAKARGPTDAGWQTVAQHLGRAMHAFEDFWAHSNWVEMAHTAHERLAAGKPIETGAAANRELKTGTFTLPAKAHALGHKLVGLSQAFQGDFDKLLRVFGRTKASDKLDTDAAKEPNALGRAPSDHDVVFDPLNADRDSSVAELADVGTIGLRVGAMTRTRLGGAPPKYEIADFLCNTHFLQALAEKGHRLIEQGDAEAPEDSHGKLAKDQPEGDGHKKDHATASALAKHADELVFAPLRAIMDERDAAKAIEATHRQLALVDAMLQAPSPGHPLWGMVAR